MTIGYVYFPQPPTEAARGYAGRVGGFAAERGPRVSKRAAFEAEGCDLSQSALTWAHNDRGERWICWIIPDDVAERAASRLDGVDALAAFQIRRCIDDAREEVA